MAQSSAGNPDVPDMGRRQFMNLLTFGTVTGVALGALYPVVQYFVPPASGAVGGGVTAKDALGNDIIVSEYLASHPAGDRSLAQGLKGDPHLCCGERRPIYRRLRHQCSLHSLGLRRALEC